MEGAQGEGPVHGPMIQVLEALRGGGADAPHWDAEAIKAHIRAPLRVEATPLQVRSALFLLRVAPVEMVPFAGQQANCCAQLRRYAVSAEVHADANGWNLMCPHERAK